MRRCARCQAIKTLCRKSAARLWLPLMLAALACNLPGGAPSPGGGGESVLPTQPATAAATHTAAPAGPAEHRIGVRVLNGVGEFYDRVTDAKFIPRGVNYIQLERQKRDDGQTQVYHAVFDPGVYDGARIETDMQTLHANGYNTVRVFLSQNTIVTTGPDLDPAYMDNFVDFLRLAESNGLYVIPTIDWMPGGRYGVLLNRDCCDQFAVMNVHFMTQGGLEANQAFFKDFAKYLLDHGAPMDALLAYELRNELFFDSEYPPLSFKSGTLATADGKSYDMANDSSKKQMMDENLVYWIDHVRQSILEVDPTALVTVGFFWPQSPNPARMGDERYINTQPAIWSSKADFIDLHAYPDADLNLKQFVENFGINGMQEKPIVMGEFGVSTSTTATEEDAARILLNWQVDLCKYGFDGWILWDWDVHDTPTNYFNYGLMSGKGEVNQVLAPVSRPDPCAYRNFDFIQFNAATKANITASSYVAGSPPSLVADGTQAHWNAAAPAPQWIELDMHGPTDIDRIALTVAQNPAGRSVHEVWVQESGGQLNLVHTFDGVTADGDVLSFQPETPLKGVIKVKVVTTYLKDLWPAWTEIEILTSTPPK